MIIMMMSKNNNLRVVFGGRQRFQMMGGRTLHIKETGENSLERGRKEKNNQQPAAMKNSGRHQLLYSMHQPAACLFALSVYQPLNSLTIGRLFGCCLVLVHGQ